MPVNAQLSQEKKAAKAAYDREYRRKNAEKIRAAKSAWGKTEVKKAYDKRWAEENRERSNEIKKAWKERNPDADKNYYAMNAETVKAYNRKRGAELSEEFRKRSAAWKAEHPEQAKEAYHRCYVARRGDYIARARARKTKIERATPAWADRHAINEIYRVAGEQGMHVDHIIPLNGKTVTGLHVPANLQLLTPIENMRKGNRYAG